MEQFQSYNQYLVYMDQNYDEEEQLIIEDFISYYINKYRGFGHHNCEDTYQDNIRHDTNGMSSEAKVHLRPRASGDLHKFALIGVDFEKKMHDECELQKYNKIYKLDK